MALRSIYIFIRYIVEFHCSPDSFRAVDRHLSIFYIHGKLCCFFSIFSIYNIFSVIFDLIQTEGHTLFILIFRFLFTCTDGNDRVWTNHKWNLFIATGSAVPFSTFFSFSGEEICPRSIRLRQIIFSNALLIKNRSHKQAVT